MDKYTEILDCWNAQKKFGRWKTHRKVTPDIKDAINENLKDGWDIEDICGAIRNFAECYHSRDTKWTYGGWSLAQFLSRGKLDKERGRKWIGFTDNNYRLEDWLTNYAVQKNIKQRRLVEQGGRILATDEDKARIRAKIADTPLGRTLNIKRKDTQDGNE
ncbi:MAG: hypothetical protein KAS32_10505 [Candidatus Peribacteraceae bacterium]|nr:hypothetical protein [Candidatus Peribacteraceae bacterium]